MEGIVHDSREHDAGNGRGPVLKAVSGRANLADLVGEFVLFTHGLFFTHGDLDLDPVQEFVNAQEGESIVSLLTFDEPIIDWTRPAHRLERCDYDSGIPWGHQLLAAERNCWQKLYRFLTGVAAIDRDRGMFWRAVPHPLIIADVLALKKKAVLPSPVPRVPITVFGLTGNLGRVMVRPTGPFPARPRVVILSPSKAAKRSSHAALQEDPDIRQFPRPYIW